MENRALGEHIISFSAQNAPFSRKRSRTDLCGGALHRTFPGLHTLRPVPATPYSAPCRPVRLQLRPAWFLYRLVRLLRRPAWLPHDPAPSSRRARLPILSPGAHITAACFRVAPATSPFARQSCQGGAKQKKSAFLWCFRKIITTFTTYCSDNLVSAPQRFARRIRLSSHPGNSDDG